MTVLILSTSGLSQDVHFSQFFATPLFTNPAFTGHFDGTYRFSGMIGRQWQSVSPEPFQTHGGGIDLRDAAKIKGLGIGLSLLQDFAGLSSTTFNQAKLSLASHIRIGSAKRGGIHLGGTVGYFTSSNDISRLSWNNQFNGTQHDPTLPSGEIQGNQVNKLNYSGGIYVDQVANERHRFGVGLAIQNIAEPDISMFKASENKMFRLYSAHVLSSFPIGATWDIMPAGRAMIQGPYDQYIIGTAFRHHLVDSEISKQSFQFGFWGRWKDAGYVSAGLQMEDLYVGASYDVNLSLLQPATNYRGAWEVTLIYIIRTVREKSKRLRVCPDYL